MTARLLIAHEFYDINQRSNERDLKISNHDYFLLSSSLSNQNPPCYSILITYDYLK